MKALLTPVMIMIMMAASEPTGETGMFGCHVDSPFKYNFRELFDWKLALTQCTKPRTAEFCQSQLDNCVQILSKLHGEMDDQTAKALPGYTYECSELLNDHIKTENFPTTLAELQERCFTLNKLANIGVTVMNLFPLYRCVAYKLDWDQMDRFTACINGLE